jgi:PKD domain
MPGNAWLNGQVTANVNNTGTCNGFWNGSSIQLYQAVAGACGASGEEPGFILHEYGHGLDQNDGGSFEFATSEAYSDLIAAITLHNSCIGPGFRTANCGAYGDACTACTGLRDIDWARHVSGTPHTVANYTQAYCNFGSGGPCGGEVHCESHVASEAVWDFANRDLPSPGSAAAWNALERLWYLSRSSSTNAFTCNSGSIPYTSHGCNVGSWWKTMRAVDDDDGNLANGTPHSAALFAAFNRHGIACASDPGAATSFRGCTQPAVPALSLTSGNNQVTVSWSGSTGIYDVYRNETGCNAAFTRIGNDVAGSSLVDNGVATGSTYYYQVVAHPGGNEACASAPSACQAITVTVPPPVANFTFACTGLSCAFNGSGSTGSGLTYAWSFGDSGTGSGSTSSHVYGASGVYTATLTVTDSLGQQSARSKKVSVTNDPVAPAESYFAVAPCRILDTRNTTILTSNQPRVVNITGSCGIPSTAKAVSFNATAVAPTGSGKITLYPGNLTASWSGERSSLNFAPATSPRANSAVIQLATDGTGTLGINAVVSGSPGQVHLVLDVQGYFSTDTTPAPGAQGPLGFQTLPICRMADTRPSSPLVAGTVRTFTAQGVCGVPSGAVVASMHVGVIEPAYGGYITLYPSNIATPLVSAINFTSGISALRNGARVNLSPTTPDFAAYFGSTAGAAVHATFDVNGYFKSDAPLKYHPIAPCRAIDTNDPALGGPALVADVVRTFQIQGNCGVPVGAKAVVARLKVSAPTSVGVMSVYPSNLPLPPYSTIQFDANEPELSMGTIVPLSTLADDLAVSPNKMTAGGTLHLLIDVFGYFQ